MLPALLLHPFLDASVLFRALLLPCLVLCAGVAECFSVCCFDTVRAAWTPVPRPDEQHLFLMKCFVTLLAEVVAEKTARRGLDGASAARATMKEAPFQAMLVAIPDLTRLIARSDHGASARAAHKNRGMPPRGEFLLGEFREFFDEQSGCASVMGSIVRVPFHD